jgi:hypothetical protein
MSGMADLQRDIVENPGNADIYAELERVVAGPCLTKSPQLANFLRFVVEAVLAGNGSRIKGYTIATDALGRDARFDPQADPIVRVEAGRLRRALEHYYANGGSRDPVVIELPRGGYVPVFRANTAPHGAVARVQGWRRQFAGTLRGNYRLVIAMVVVATTVSLGFDMMWKVLDKMNKPAAETAQQAVPPVTSTSISADGVKR